MDKPPKNVKILFILMDGVGDCQVKHFNDKTCLQVANIPHIDYLTKSGISGLMDPVETGLSCGSDTAHMNILGYNPFEEYRGRGSFETMGSGLDMNPGEIGFKCNFAHMDKDCIVKKRRVDRGFESWGLPLITLIDGMEIKGYDGYKIRAQHATEHRCGVKITGGDQLSCKITGTDPLKDNLKLRAVTAKDRQDEKSVFTAKIVNSVSQQINETLEQHEINENRKKENKLTANIVLLRGCGERLNVKTFQEVHGLKGFMIAPTAIIKGLGQTVGMKTPDVEGATGDYHSNYINKVKAAINLFENENYDFGFIHIKAVDDAGHDKSGEKKVESIEKVNQMLQHFIESQEVQSEYVLCVTGDHTTPYVLGDHTFEPVPVSISVLSQIKQLIQNQKESQNKMNDDLSELSFTYQDRVSQYDENSVGQGVLGRFPGSQLLGILKKIRNQLQQ